MGDRTRVTCRPPRDVGESGEANSRSSNARIVGAIFGFVFFGTELGMEFRSAIFLVAAPLAAIWVWFATVKGILPASAIRYQACIGAGCVCFLFGILGLLAGIESIATNMACLDVGFCFLCVSHAVRRRMAINRRLSLQSTSPSEY